jgi:membrane protease YdiL (CAAX protease family)
MNEFFERERMSSWAQLGLLIGLCGVGIVIYAIFTALFATTALHISFSDLENALNNPANVEAVRFLETMGSFFVMFLPAIVFAVIVDRKPFEPLGFNVMISRNQVFYVIILFFAALFVSAALAELNEWIPISKSLATKFKQLEDEYDKQIMVMGYMKNNADFLMSLLVLALMPAIFEETLFRGALQPVMIKISQNAFVGILFTAIIFSAIHGSYYGFLPRLFLGLVLGYVFYFSKNIWLNITVHFLNNAIAVAEMYSLSKSGKLNVDNMQDHFPVYLGIIGVIVVIVLLFFFKRESKSVLAKYVVSEENTTDFL